MLLSLQPHEPLTSAKEKLLKALKSREIREINGDPIPEDPADIEFGVPVDRGDLEKGWTRLQTNPSAPNNDDASKKPAKNPKNSSETLLAAGLENGHSVAFRFRKPSDAEKDDELGMDIDWEDPGWDVIVPSFDDLEA